VGARCLGDRDSNTLKKLAAKSVIVIAARKMDIGLMIQATRQSTNGFVRSKKEQEFANNAEKNLA
jgi:hypothetical protein